MQARIDTSFASALGARELADDWRALAQARDAGQLCRAWLGVLCRTGAGVSAGLLLLKDGDGSFAPVATWPDDRDLSYLGGAAQEALMKREGVIRHQAEGAAQVAYPLLSGEAPFGAVVLDLEAVDDSVLAAAMRFLHWGAGWLIDLDHGRSLAAGEARLERSAFLFDIMLATLAEEDFGQAALAAVNRLAQRFACRQVQLGIEKGSTVDVAAVSHSAWFDRKASLVNLAAQAMNEAFDQRARILWPAPEADGNLISAALGRYAGESGCANLCAMPMEAGNRVTGVWLLERDTAFTPAEQDEMEMIGLALGPVLALKRAGQQSLPAIVAERARRALGLLTDTSHAGAKLVAAVLAVLLVVLALVPADHRVAARALVEGAVQRAAVAPFQGYLREAPARAGDVVREGQLLARLEDKDLKLEQVRWESELEVALRRGNEAMAKADRVAVRMSSAQANQARAQLDLVLEKLARVRVTAPFDGVVVRGDLSQELGSPVEQGKVLFELAPLDAWRVILKVDERDIAWVREGAAGDLVVTSLPGQTMRVAVRKVTPVATAEDGRNYFRVEASIPEGLEKLRPGMEGVAKIGAGRRSLLWIWTHRLTDWVRLAIWEHTP